MNNPFFSVIIPVKEINAFLRSETIPALLKNSFQNFEIIIITDKKSSEKFPQTKIIPSWPKTGPADKRDLGAQKARGEVLVFLDDDSYPDSQLLKNARQIFQKHPEIAGLGGPSLTPPGDNPCQKASGYVWSTWLGSGGAGTYRCLPGHRRHVDDFPTVNLMIRQKDFSAVGGFNSRFWPGEDTKLCHDLVYKLGKKILYDPNCLVYHHRRAIFAPHLKQISRYAIHRGFFARTFPKTSLRIGYFIPSLFALTLIVGLVASFLLPALTSFYLIFLSVYSLLLLQVAFDVYFREKNFFIAFLTIPAIFITHFVYGLLFIKGFFSTNLKR